MSTLDQLQELAGAPLSAAIADGGLEFERLEWLGDSLLDAIVIRHVMLTAHPAVPVANLLRRHSQLVRDDTLIAIAKRAGLPRVGHSSAKDAEHRRGDSVEAWVGAGYVAHGWPGAARVASMLVLPDVGPELLLAPARAPRGFGGTRSSALAASIGHRFVDEGWLRLVLSPVPWRRRLVPVGAEVLEAAYALNLFADHPTEDEGALSRRRAGLLQHEHIAEIAAKAGVSARGWKGNDRLFLALLGAVSLDGGPERAVNELNRLIG